MKNKIIPFFYILFIIVFFSSCAMKTLVNEILGKGTSDNSSDGVTFSDLKVTLSLIKGNLTLGDLWLKDDNEPLNLNWDYQIRGTPYFPISADALSDLNREYSWPNHDILTLPLNDKSIISDNFMKIPGIDLDGTDGPDIDIDYIEFKKSSITAYIKLNDIESNGGGILKINANQFKNISADITINERRGTIKFDIIRNFDPKIDNTNDVLDFVPNDRVEYIVVAIANGFLSKGWKGNLFPNGIENLEINEIKLELDDNTSDRDAVHNTGFTMLAAALDKGKQMKFDTNLHFSFGDERDISVIGKVHDKDINIVNQSIDLGDFGFFEITEVTLETKLTSDFPFGIKIGIKDENGEVSSDFKTDKFNDNDPNLDGVLVEEGYQYKIPQQINMRASISKTFSKGEKHILVDIIPLTDGSGKNIGNVLFDADASCDFKIDLTAKGTVKVPF